MRTILLYILLLLVGFELKAQPGTIKKCVKISANDSVLKETYLRASRFGNSITDMGDLNGDGLPELAVGMPSLIGPGFFFPLEPSIWVLTLRADGSAEYQWHAEESDYSYDRERWYEFGTSVAMVGDFDGDGESDLAVSRPYPSSMSAGGDVGILRSSGLYLQGGFWLYNVIGNVLDIRQGDHFGGGQICPLASLLNKNDLFKMAVGCTKCDTNGAVFILHFTHDHSLVSYVKFSKEHPALKGKLSSFGTGLANIGDFDGNGIADLAIGDTRRDSASDQKGAVFLMFRNKLGELNNYKIIDDSTEGFRGVLDPGDCFGQTIANLGDMDGDGVTDIAVSAYHYSEDSAKEAGAVYILFLNKDATVKSYQKITSHTANFNYILNSGDYFGTGLSRVGDLDGDGVPELAVGAPGDDDGFNNSGAVYILFLNGVPQVGLKEQPKAVKSLKLYPNPASTTVHISIPETDLPYDASIHITNALGQVVYAGPVAENHIQVSLEGLIAGVYTVNISGATHRYCSQLVIVP